jgi:hypothetical protein
VKLSVWVFTLGLLPAAARASGFSYDYLDLGHEHIKVQTNSNGFSGDGSGSFADFSYTVFDGIQFRGRYDSLKFASPADYTAKDYSVGVTGESQVSDTTDVYTDILYFNNHYSSSRPIPLTDNGYRLALGLRHKAWDRLELDGYIGHNYLTLASNEAGAGFMFNATSWLAVGGSYSHDSNYNNTVSLKLRLYF